MPPEMKRLRLPDFSHLLTSLVLQHIECPGSGTRLITRHATPCVCLWHKGQRLVAQGKKPESGPIRRNDAEDVGQVTAPKPSQSAWLLQKPVGRQNTVVGDDKCDYPYDVLPPDPNYHETRQASERL